MKLIKILFSILLLVTATAGVANSQPVKTHTIEFTSTRTVIKVSAKQPKFSITLESNRTTGYSWELKKYDANLIKMVSHKYVAPNSKLMGAPGYEIWNFKAKSSAFNKARTTKIVLVYKRPWEKHSGKRAVFRVYLMK